MRSSWTDVFNVIIRNIHALTGPQLVSYTNSVQRFSWIQSMVSKYMNSYHTPNESLSAGIISIYEALQSRLIGKSRRHKAYSLRNTIRINVKLRFIMIF